MSGWNIIRTDVIDSTNSEAKRRAAAGLRERTVFTADTQLAGRGRFARRWESPPGAGLWMTQLFSPAGVAAGDAGGAVFISALALTGVLRDITGADILIKWPNDLVLNGKKICGMLAECGFAGGLCDWIALGTGLNLKKDALPEGLPFASSVEAETGLLPDREYLLAGYLAEFDRIERLWEKEGLAPVLSGIAPLSATVGRSVRVDGVPAFAAAIDSDGALICDFEDGRRRVLAGDVTVRGLAGYI